MFFLSPFCHAFISNWEIIIGPIYCLFFSVLFISWFCVRLVSHNLFMKTRHTKRQQWQRLVLLFIKVDSHSLPVWILTCLLLLLHLQLLSSRIFQAYKINIHMDEIKRAVVCSFGMNTCRARKRMMKITSFAIISAPQKIFIMS